MTLTLTLNPALDTAMLARRFAVEGRLQIAGLLTDESARALHAAVAAFDGWNLHLHKGDASHEIFPEQRALMSDEQVKTVRRLVDAAAVRGFQYIFENFPVYDAWHAGRIPPAFAALFTFLNSEAFLGLMNDVTGHKDISFADAQLTRFTTGDFLTEHDDNLYGKDRRAAYVLNLTPEWRADWGGILHFFGPDGQVEQGFVPAFNVLNIFSIPKPHAVSQVSSFAPHARLSVTGWLRSGTDPGPAR